MIQTTTNGAGARAQTPEPGATLDWSAPFESLAAGLSFSTPARTITEQDVLAFAHLTGDTHPQHVDAEWAASSAFGEQIAHGMLVLSIAVGLVPFDVERIIALRRVDDVVFKRPVRLGSEVRVEGAITAVHPVTPTAGLVTSVWSVIDRDDRVAVRAHVELLWRGDDIALDDPEAA